MRIDAPAFGVTNAQRPKGDIARRESLGYAVVDYSTPQGINVGVLNHVRSSQATLEPHIEPAVVLATLRRLAGEAGVMKLVAAGVVSGQGTDVHPGIRRALWSSDVVPEPLQPGSDTGEGDRVIDLCRTVGQRFTEDGTAIVNVDQRTGRVYPSRIGTLEDWKEVTPEQTWDETMAIIDQAAERFAGWKLVRINTTAQAGGVAGMLHPAGRFIEEYNRDQEAKIRKGETGHPFDFRWHVMNRDIDPEIAQTYGIDLKDPAIIQAYRNPDLPEGVVDVFMITKKFHNILQGQETPGETITDTDRRIHAAWTDSQAKRLEEVLTMDKTVFWIDDQQPVGLIRHILAHNPDAPIVERLHIQVRNDLATDPDSPQRKVLDFLLDHMTGDGARIDAFLSHRSRDQEIDGFIPRAQDGSVEPRIADKIMYKVATADTNDGLGRPLDPLDQEKKPIREYYLDLANDYLESTGQAPLDLSVGHIGQFARWDRAKNYSGAVKAYAQFVALMQDAGIPFAEIPEQILCGFGATDDPDGVEELRKTRALIAEQFPHLQDKIKTLRLDYAKYGDQTMRALEEICDVGEQLSTAEGCEDKITQLLGVGVGEMIVADVGGMPPQIINGVNGHLVNPHDHSGIAGHLVSYYTEVYPSPAKRKEASERARVTVNQEYLTPANVRDMIGIAALLKDDRERIPSLVSQGLDARGRYPFVGEVIAGEYRRMAQGNEHTLFSAH